MNTLTNNILGSYAVLSVNGNMSMSPNLISNTFNTTTAYNILIDDNTKINQLKRSIIFKNDLIALNLINNKELLDCLTDTIEIISNSGLYFHADLDITHDDDGEYNDVGKYILVYYPVLISKDTSISSQEEVTENFNNRLFRTVIRNLYKYSISIRKSMIIDEQYI